jgi:acyl carrier protein
MSMGSPRSRAEETIKRFLSRTSKDAEVGPETSLFADGIGLDSLETAELSAMLEDELGADPFSDGLTAQTIGQVLDYYSDESQPA